MAPTARGYLAVPASAGRGPGGRCPGPWPGVVVIHEAFGLNDDIRTRWTIRRTGTSRSRPTSTTAGPGCAAYGRLPPAPGRVWSRVHGAGGGAAFLAARDDCSGKVGVIGFCMGGGFALLCAPREGFAVASVNYGEVPKDAERALRGACPIVGSYGGRDQMGTKHPERLQRALRVLEVPHDIEVYPGSGHRFMTEASGPAAVLASSPG